MKDIQLLALLIKPEAKPQGTPKTLTQALHHAMYKIGIHDVTDSEIEKMRLIIQDFLSQKFTVAMMNGDSADKLKELFEKATKD